MNIRINYKDSQFAVRNAVSESCDRDREQNRIEIWDKEREDLRKENWFFPSLK
jgi:hypothetical protein